MFRHVRVQGKKLKDYSSPLRRRSFFWISAVGALGLLEACKNFDNKQELSEITATENDDEAATRILEEALVAKGLTGDCPQNQVCATILAVNDVYEIDAVGGGAYGGLDRVAALRKILAKNPSAGPVITMIAGDFFNPSGLGTIKEDNKPWAGRHMVSVLKAAGLDIAMFGNHEFDLSWPDFKARLDESVTPQDPIAEACLNPQSSGNGFQLTDKKDPVFGLPNDQDRKNMAKVESGHGTYAPTSKPRLSEKNLLIDRGPLSSQSLSLVDQRPSCTQTVYEGGYQGPRCFEYISSNVFAASGALGVFDPNLKEDIPFKALGEPIPQARVLHIKRGELSFKLGVIALTLNKNQKDYQRFTDVDETARILPPLIRKKTRENPADRVIAVTHLLRADDIKILKAVPEIALTIGGHEHKNSFDCVDGPQGTKRCVAKADANARTAYIHRLMWNPTHPQPSQQLTIMSHLWSLDKKVPRDIKVRNLIQCWYERADKAMASAKGGAKSFKLKSEIAKISSESLDGTEEAVRNRKGSNLTNFYVQAMLNEGNKEKPSPPPFTFAMMNAGTIRIDDKVGPGKVTFYEAVRVMPFGGNLATVEVKIADLAQILKRSWKDIPEGSGGLLHLFPKIPSSDRKTEEIDAKIIAEELRMIARAPNVDSKVRVVTTAYLVSFGEDLNSDEKSKFKLTSDKLSQPDMRDLLVEALREKYPLD